jgi:hypothetical protein
MVGEEVFSTRAGFSPFSPAGAGYTGRRKATERKEFS